MADSKLLNPSNSTSPPPNCAICLGSCSNKCFSDTCMHQFCFNCLLQWSKIKAECPLCKQPFKSIIHNVKSNEEYEEHIVEETRPIHIIDNEQYLYLPQSPPNPSRQHRFHFRTTFTVNTHGENAIQQMLLSHSLTNGISISNYMPGSWPPYNRRSRRDNISTTTSFRRSIYNSNLWASAPVDVSGRYREVTPEYFQANPASRTRLAPWLNRELNALLHENTQDVMQLVDTIMDYLLRYHICSRSFRNLLQTYLGDRTDHFVHEFYNFMRSPFDMIGYDRNVIYMERPTSPTPYIDISEDDSSDVMIVEENPVVIEVSSNDSSDSDVIMTSFPNEMPKPQLLPVSRKSCRRSRHIESSASSSSSDREQNRIEERTKRRKKRKDSHQNKNKKVRPLKLADFVMNDSSSSELDDLPLAKYIRIKASIKRILKKKSHSSKQKSSRKKSKLHQKKSSSNDKSNSKRKEIQLPKIVDLLSPISSRPHCSKYTSRRRDSSSSSSSSSSSTSSSSSSSSSQESLRSRFSSKYNAHSSSTVISPISSPPPQPLSKDKKRKTIQHQSLDLSSSSNKTTVHDSDRNDDESMTPCAYSYLKYQNQSKNGKPPQDFCNFPLFRTQDQSLLDVPSTSSGLRDRTRAKSPRSRTRVGSSSSKAEQPLELTNHCRYSPFSINPYISVEKNELVSPPTLLTINPNLSRNVSQSVNSYSSPQSPDLIDLSLSRIKTDNAMLDVYFSDLSKRPSGDLRPKFEQSQPYPWASTSQQSSSFFVPKTEPKTEPVYPEYHSEGLSRYWTDLAVQNPILTSSNDSYGCFGPHNRKSVIQNSGSSRDYALPYNETISPRWSTSNSPSYPGNTEQRWSESSD